MNFSDTKLALPKAVVKTALSAVPVIGSAVTEIIGYFDDKYIEKRLLKLESKLGELKILENFITALNELDEHKYYSFRNNLKFLLTEAVPETVDAFLLAMIDSIMSETHEMAEEACEIIRQLNANDIRTLRLLKSAIEKKKGEVNAG